MSFKIVDDIIDNINLDRIREFNRLHNLKVSGTKDDLINLIENAVNNSKLDISVVNKFIAEEISHGKNRVMFVSTFPDSSGRNLNKSSYVRSRLNQNGYPHINFNDLSKRSCPENTDLFYLKIHKYNALVKKIAMCFARTTIIEGLVDEEGIELPPRKETEYTWVDILPDEREIHIKARQKHGHHFTANAHLREQYEEISTIVREIFDLSPMSMEGVKNTLYKIFSNLIKEAEQPFRDKILPYYDNITKFSKDIAKSIELSDLYEPIDLPHRITRLLERALIQQEFHRYEGYFEGKRGVVNRIYFSDATGASVNARSSEVEEGIAVADIYFDTKESIEKLQKLDKIWVTWFYHIDDELTKIETKFEVAKEHFTIHYLYAYTTKEMQKHVLSNFKHFENLPPN